MVSDGIDDANGGTGRLLFTSSPSKFLVARRHSCARDENGATMRKRADVGGLDGVRDDDTGVAR